MRIWMKNKYENIYAIIYIVFCWSLIITLLLSGCQEQQVINKSPREQLVKSPADWIEKYGDGLESQQTANIVLAIQVINRQGEAIKQLNERLVVLEAGDVIDPNEVKE